MNMIGGLNLTVKVTKEDILATLKANRIKHLQMYQEALDGYLVDLEKTLKEHHRLVRRAKKTRAEASAADYGNLDVRINTTKPTCQAKAYDVMIRMFERDQSKVVELSTDDYTQIMEDEFHWTRGWLEGASRFSDTARSYRATKGR